MNSTNKEHFSRRRRFEGFALARSTVSIYCILPFLTVVTTYHIVFHDRKTASLGEMIQQLAPLGVDVPGGFGVTSYAYDAVLDQSNLRERLTTLLAGVDGTKLYYVYYVNE